mgnify:CR=1 FL=1
MSTNTNKTVVSAFYEDLERGDLERGDFSALNQHFHDDFIFYSQIDTPKPGVNGFIASQEAPSLFAAYATNAEGRRDHRETRSLRPAGHRKAGGRLVN